MFRLHYRRLRGEGLEPQDAAEVALRDGVNDVYPKVAKRGVTLVLREGNS